MTTLRERLVTAAEDFTWQVPLCGALQCLIDVLTDDYPRNFKLQVGASTILSAFSIKKLRQMNLMGDKFAAFLATTYAVFTVAALRNANFI